MRLNQTIHNIVRSGVMIGDTKPCGKVTIEPDWTLKSTEPIYDGSVRGPFRYWQDAANDQVEIEVPNVKSIQIERSTSQDIATCNISIYNQWHYSNNGSTGVMVTELPDQLGKPGYFWPKRGDSEESQLLWNQESAKGAKFKDGTYDPLFDWTNVIVPNALIRTYQGYGGNNLSVQDAIDNENIMITGAWLIDSITAGTDGMLNIQCRDVGRLLLEQITYPPLVPQTLYPIEYRAPGISAFDSTFGPDPRGSFNGSFGEVRLIYRNSATDNYYNTGNYSIFGHKGSDTVDGESDTYALSPAQPTPVGSNENGYFWWDYYVRKEGGRLHPLQGITIKPWGGGYTAYISVKHMGNWVGKETVHSYGLEIPYVKKVQIPLMPPDGNERDIYIDFDIATPHPDQIFFPEAPELMGGYLASEIRITLGDPLMYSGIADDNGNNYRCGIRSVTARAVGKKASEYTTPFSNLPWTYAMEAHPIRGYWVCESNGYVHGFGDAYEYDSTSLGPVNFYMPPLASGVPGIHYIPGFRGVYPHPGARSMAAHPSGEGYWIIDPTGRVYAFGEATHYGQYVVPWRGETFALIGVTAMGIAATYTGNGYWVIYSNGTIRGFGDASPSFAQTPYTSVTAAMVNSGRRYTYIFGKNNELGFDIGHQPSQAYNWARRGTAIASHPNKMAFWATDGSGQVWSWGAPNYGRLVDRIYNKNGADSFRLSYLNWATSITATKTGKGYWVTFGDGHIAAFGDAVKQGTSYIYQGNPQIKLNVPEDKVDDWSFFRYIVWDLARDPDGKGFWVLTANGSVLSYDARSWGQPGWWGKTGYRWSEGNYKEYIDIIKDMLCWSGFTYYDSTINNIKSWTTLTINSGTYQSVDDYKLLMQTDGNLVWGNGNLVTVGGVTTLSDIDWQSRTSGNSGAYAVMKSDGNFVIYSSSGSIIFQTNTNQIGSKLILRYDGYLGIQSTGGADLWIGYGGASDSNDRPSVYGNIESTGIVTDTSITGDKFDKRTIVDCINEIKQVVGYNFYIDQEGGARFESPNWWSAGNFDSYGDGKKIYVTYDNQGNYTRIDLTGDPQNYQYSGQSTHFDPAPILNNGEAYFSYNVNPGAPASPDPLNVVFYHGGVNYPTIDFDIFWNIRETDLDGLPTTSIYYEEGPVIGFVFPDYGTYNIEYGISDKITNATASQYYNITISRIEAFIPEISEAITMKSYQASLSGESLRSEIIIGSDAPDPNNPKITSFVKYSPGSANDEIRPGVPALRNIVRPAIWIDKTFTNKEEQKLMAELINLQIWFSQRAGSLNCVANPNIEINDQIRIIERNTSETYIHYVRGISSSMDLDTGQYEMSITTNWLGDENDWVITSDNVYNPITHISISERVDRWQQITGRNLQFSGLGRQSMILSGGFN